MKPKIKKQLPYDFIFDELEGCDYIVKPMFGGHAVYVGEKIVLILHKKDRLKEDMGIWVCIPDECTQEMKAEYPQLKGVSFFEDENSAWQCLRETDEDFEPLAIEFCKLIKRGDPRIGRVPKQKKIKTPKLEPVSDVKVPMKKKLEQEKAKKAKKHSKFLAAKKKRKR